LSEGPPFSSTLAYKGMAWGWLGCSPRIVPGANIQIPRSTSKEAFCRLLIDTSLETPVTTFGRADTRPSLSSSIKQQQLHEVSSIKYQLDISSP
jgi:hypothetical protein